MTFHDSTLKRVSHPVYYSINAMALHPLQTVNTLLLFPNPPDLVGKSVFELTFWRLGFLPCIAQADPKERGDFERCFKNVCFQTNIGEG